MTQRSSLQQATEPRIYCDPAARRRSAPSSRSRLRSIQNTPSPDTTAQNALHLAPAGPRYDPGRPPVGGLFCRLLLAAPIGWTLALLPGCEPGTTDAGSAPAAALTSLATQNAGTTTWLDLVADSPSEAVRENCSSYYSNNLCWLESEGYLLAAVEDDGPDLVFLQEMWDMPGCHEVERPDEVNQAPYACGGSGSQLERVLPEGYDYACAAGYPDNCIAFRQGTMELRSPEGTQASCDGRDCSDFLVSNPADCGGDGRIAWMSADTEAGALALVVVHAAAGAVAEDLECRAAQLQSIQAVLEALPEDTSIAMAGDFNLDPEIYEGVDAQTFAELQESLGLTRLEADQATHLISHVSLDHLLIRGPVVAGDLSCKVRFLDEGQQDTMFDHGFVSCR